MSNAAIKRGSAAPTMTRTIRFQKRGEPVMEMLMGNFVYERDPGPDGPFILTILSLPDRSAQNNEPILVISNVVAFEPDPGEHSALKTAPVPI